MCTVSLAAIQFSCSWDRDENIATADRLVRRAAEQGGQVVLIPELFDGRVGVAFAIGGLTCTAH